MRRSSHPRICEGLSFLGFELNAPRNAETAGVISTDASWVTGSVTRTDEELMIARSVLSSCASINAGQRKLDEH